MIIVLVNIVSGLISIYAFIENVRDIYKLKQTFHSFDDPVLKMIDQCTDPAYHVGNL